ncbi:uncharacterized protein LOC119025579 [Acanthopagrus latus]|uniref:uncharacterized protein LOC119025579 n=1 Tax=Acanthopagrus latus TaxID=8177 RepID=UPI00187CEC11|nr:uncharacterized protein LOC119025579 [Acanthopagrus latus]
MSSTILLIILSAHITGLISEQLLRAAVGGSVLINCSLPGYPLSLNWFYWQEGDNPVFRWENGKEMKIEDNKYKGRFQVFTHEFSSGNISIRLDNISPEDDQKTFFAYIKFDKERQSEERCRSKLQVSGLISEQLLSAAVGGSVLIPCSLPGNPLTFYWQEDQSSNQLCHWDNGKTLPACDKYKGRFQVFNSEFSSGNISIRLDNISPEDDQKTFFAFVHFYDEQKKVAKPSEERCRSTLQVSAPYQDLVLMVNHTTNSATCSARGGYPAAQVSWKGLMRSSDEELDLQDAETFLQSGPTEKTFSFTSSVNVRGLKSVTCIVYNPHSNKTITRTENIDTGENKRIHVAAILGSVVLIILAGVYLYKKKCAVQDPRNPEPDVPNPQDPVQEEAPTPDQDPDQPNQPPVDSNAKEPAQEEAAPDQDQDQARAQDPDQPNQSPVDRNTHDGAQAEGEAADAPEDTVLISEDRAAFHRPTRTSEGTADRDTCEDAAASPEKEKLLKKENGTEDRASD